MPGKKKLLIITNRFYPQIGGAELNIFYQAQELSKHFYVDVLTPIRDKDRRRESTSDMSILRARNLRNPFNRFPYLSSRTLCPSVATRVFLGKYDVIHCFPALNHNNMIALFLARLKGTPIFLSNFDAFDYADLLNKGMHLTQFANLSLSQRQTYSLSKFNAIFTISQKETSLLRMANPNTFLSTVPINLDEYTKEVDVEELRKSLGIVESQKVILCLSRVSYIKGQDILLKTVPELKKKLENFVVVFVGRVDYEPDFFNEMKTFVRANGLEKNVIFTGPLSRDNVLAALRMCDVHVLPMRFMNSGAINSETWASGNPIIQSRSVDPNYVEEGVNGFTFDVGDNASLIDKILQILNNPELGRQMGENGKKLAMEKFTYPYLIKQYIDAYHIHGGIDL
ncbi:glycosyltransferase family 4 protein [Candidatus Hydrogenedentota bacterium]